MEKITEIMVIQNFHKLDGFTITTNTSNVKITTFSQVLVEDKEANKKQVRTYMGIADVFDARIMKPCTFPKERWDLHLIIPYYEGCVEKVKVKLKKQQSTNEIHHVVDLSAIKTLNRFKHLLVTIFKKHS